MKTFIIGLISGNYFYQYMQDMPSYLVATERTYFMLVGIGIFYLLLKLQGRI